MRRSQVNSYVNPNASDLIRIQTKQKNTDNLKYLKDDAEAIKVMQSQIPTELFRESIPEYQEFPIEKSLKPEVNIPTTFGTQFRFKQGQIPQGGGVSALDYQSHFQDSRGPSFDMYSTRKDNFLTKE